MKKTIIISYLFLIAFAGSLFANEVNIFSARHYDSDVQLYQKFTAKTGIKVNVVSGKSGALEKRIIEEGADSKADLYITADAGRLGLLKLTFKEDLLVQLLNQLYQVTSERQNGLELLKELGLYISHRKE